MRERLLGMCSIIAVGCSFQLNGCQSQQIGDILAASVRTTAVEVSTFIVEALVDEALGLP